MSGVIPKDEITSLKPGSYLAEIIGQTTEPDISLDELGDLIEGGAVAKVVAKIPEGSEAFWVVIVEAYMTDDGLVLVGEVNNHLVHTPEHGLEVGDLIEFAWINIRELMPIRAA